MENQIEAILFDFGGTLRKTTKRDDAGKIERVRRILETLGSKESPQEFTHLLTARYKAYRRWAKETLIELNEEQMWTQWMLPDWHAERVRSLAPQLNHLWREALGSRKILPETREIVIELFRRGYHLGVVSNTISKTDIPKILGELAISDCFQAVILSGVYGKRKPDPSMLLAAARELGVPPDRCAYVGNRPDRDVAASRKAGFATAVTIYHPGHPIDHSEEQAHIADHLIGNLSELLELFPPRNAQEKNCSSQ